MWLSHQKSHYLCVWLVHSPTGVLLCPNKIVRRARKLIYIVMHDSHCGSFDHFYWLGLPISSMRFIVCSWIISPSSADILVNVIITHRNFYDIYRDNYRSIQLSRNNQGYQNVTGWEGHYMRLLYIDHKYQRLQKSHTARSYMREQNGT